MINGNEKITKMVTNLETNTLSPFVKWVRFRRWNLPCICLSSKQDIFSWSSKAKEKKQKQHRGWWRRSSHCFSQDGEMEFGVWDVMEFGVLYLWWLWKISRCVTLGIGRVDRTESSRLLWCGVHWFCFLLCK